MNDLLDYLIKNITGSSDYEIKIDEEDDGFIKFTVVLPKEMIGLVIGKEGKTIKSLRSILRAKATLEKRGFTLEVQEK